MRLLSLAALVPLINAILAAQHATSTCREWFEPRTYQDAIVAADDPRNNRPAVIFGKHQLIPAMRVRVIDGKSNRPLPNKGVTVNYRWRWLEYPYPEHAWGAWSETADQAKCELDSDGWLEAPAHEVQPRGWYQGKYTRFPWLRRPQFTGVGIVVATEAGLFARSEIPRRDVTKFNDRDLVIRVFDGFRAETTWEKREVRTGTAGSKDEARPSSPAAGRIAAFLQAWFVDGNADAALSFFSTAAFRNRVILSESCVGGVDTITPEQARNRVRTFLAEFSRRSKGKDLTTLLNLQTLTRSDGWENMRKRAINNPERDHFIVFEASRETAAQFGESTAQQNYLKMNIPQATITVALVPLFNDGLLYMVWTGEANGMRVYHIGMFCI